jgi:hypothetical protein
MKDGNPVGSTYRETQASVAGFCITSFIAIVLFEMGLQLFKDGGTEKVLWGIACWGWAAAFAFFGFYCGYSIYVEVSEWARKYLDQIKYR